MSRMFVYGTLMFQDVVRRLIHRTVEYADATLKDYERCRVDGTCYAAIYPKLGSEVRGKIIIEDLSPKEVAIIDGYEDTGSRLFLRAPVNAVLQDGAIIQCDSYVAGPGLDGKLGGNWDPDVFVEEFLRPYLIEMERFEGR